MKWRIVLLVSGAVLIADQASKYWIRQLFHGRALDITLIPGVLKIAHVRNPGVAFGLFANLGSAYRIPILTVCTIVALGLVVHLLLRCPAGERWLAIALAGILGGALGNLIDRVVFGVVTDFIALSFWPAFNVADSAISVGVCLLMWKLLFGPKTLWTQDRAA